MDKLSEAIDEAGGVNKLARALGVRQTMVSNWRLRGRVPPRWCVPIESAVEGRVTRHDLRPDVFGPAPTPRKAVG